MKTYKIRLSDGSWIEKFFACSILVTRVEGRIGYYPKSIAVKRLADHGIIDYTLELKSNE